MLFCGASPPTELYFRTLSTWLFDTPIDVLQSYLAFESITYVVGQSQSLSEYDLVHLFPRNIIDNILDGVFVLGCQDKIAIAQISQYGQAICIIKLTGLFMRFTEARIFLLFEVGPSD